MIDLWNMRMLVDNGIEDPQNVRIPQFKQEYRLLDILGLCEMVGLVLWEA